MADDREYYQLCWKGVEEVKKAMKCYNDLVEYNALEDSGALIGSIHTYIERLPIDFASLECSSIISEMYSRPLAGRSLALAYQ